MREGALAGGKWEWEVIEKGGNGGERKDVIARAERKMARR
jgi:hypothetical protein